MNYKEESTKTYAPKECSICFTLPENDRKEKEALT